MLRAAGYRVLEDQAELEVTLRVDGVEHPYRIRVDLLVERRTDGARFAAEVKTGKSAPNPRHSATRRQLLEYRMLYDVEGVLLVDREAQRVHEVEWPDLPPRQPAAPAARRAFVRGVLMGAALGVILTGLLLGAGRCIP